MTIDTPKVLRRDHAAYVHAFFARLPRGWAWPRKTGTVIHGLIEGLTKTVARVDAAAHRFATTESFPPTSVELLPDWERVLGLPDKCLKPREMTLAVRQAVVRDKLARRPGRQDRQYFIDLAARLGYTITITEYRPFMFGVSRLGDANFRFAPPEMRFVWRVGVTTARATWFRFGYAGGRLGQDPHVRISRADDLECVLNELKPAHTTLIFDYSGV